MTHAGSSAFNIAHVSPQNYITTRKARASTCNVDDVSPPRGLYEHTDLALEVAGLSNSDGRVCVARGETEPFPVACVGEERCGADERTTLPTAIRDQRAFSYQGLIRLLQS